MQKCSVHCLSFNEIKNWLLNFSLMWETLLLSSFSLCFCLSLSFSASVFDKTLPSTFFSISEKNNFVTVAPFHAIKIIFYFQRNVANIIVNMLINVVWSPFSVFSDLHFWTHPPHSFLVICIWQHLNEFSFITIARYPSTE